MTYNNTTEDIALDLFNSIPSITPFLSYAGIGSRETPIEVQSIMTRLAKELQKLGFTLRSGGAKGADLAFEKGVETLNSKYTISVFEIYDRYYPHLSNEYYAISHNLQTSKTFFSNDKFFQHYSDIKQGDIIKIQNQQKDVIYVEAITDMYKTPVNIKDEDWCRTNAFGIKYFHKKIKPVIDVAYQFDFKFIPNKQVYLPTDFVGKEEIQIARLFHPYPKAIDSANNPDFIWKLMGRNTNQIFGRGLRNPVKFVLCWTKDGCTSHTERTQKTGGTGQAIELASRKDIPVINLFNKDWNIKLKEILTEFKKS